MCEPDTTAVVSDREWWKEAVIYQIYPKSFNDTDGDGVGDIQGIVEKVDYLDRLGVDCVWLNPIYESPGVDNGYDVANYRAIDPAYGSMDDWEELVAALHDRDIRIVMDLVLNHTSDQHVWFQRSRASDEEYADYYIWREGGAEGTDEGAEGGAYPNNWESYFEGPAWSYDEEREAYYLHLFAAEQPDLNWENPTVREELYDIVRWWLERDIDGFRLDVINLISKAEGLPDGDPDAEFLVGSEHFLNGPRMHEFFDELASEGFGDHREEVVSIGECSEIDPETAVDVTGRESDAIDMTIFFDHMNLDRRERWEPREWSLPELKTVMNEWQDAVDRGAWVSLYHSNHDQPRGLSRFGDERFRYESATMLATCLHGHRGTPFVYQGEEIGMSNVSFDSPADLRDVWARNYWKQERAAGEEFESVRPQLERFSRDHARTPMQWSNDDHAGFTDGDPWIPVADDYEDVNVDAQIGADRSILEYYRALIALRDEDDVLAYGDFELLAPTDEAVYAIRRTLDGAEHELLIICNFSATVRTFETPERVRTADATVALANRTDPSLDPRRAELNPYEAVVYRVPSSAAI